MRILAKFLVTLGGVITICFGFWHFFVPKIWNWYSYIDPKATELIIAVRAINVFFSLCLVLFGLVNIIFIHGNGSNPFSIMIMLSATSILWLTRSVLQIIYPQGSFHPLVQYGMLAVFIIISFVFLVSLGIVVFKDNLA